jgi:hypothetical protein
MGNVNLSVRSFEDNSGYTSSDDIEPVQNDPGHMTPIARVSPERGLKIAVQNRVSKGSQIGLPIYMKLRDSNGNPLPVGTDFALAMKPHGANQFFIVSDVLDNISYWITNDLTTQQNDENIDAVKVPLKYHEGSEMAQQENAGRPSSISVHGVDEMLVLAESAAQVSWNHSDFEIENEALSKGRA